MELNVFSEAEYASKLQELEAELKTVRCNGYLTAFDGLELYYEHFPKEGAKACLVLIHGFTEFSEKYHELCGYFRQAGYHVFLYDQRGHGLSGRQVSPLSLSHVDSYDDYCADLEQYLREVVYPEAKGRPVYLFAHSMGCAVVTLYLQKHPAEIGKTVMSSPMVIPVAPLPIWFLSWYTKREGKKQGFTARFPHTKDFDPNPVFEKSSDASRSRFEQHIAMRRAEPRYQNAASTHGWMHQTLNIHKKLLNKKALAAIETEILMTQAGQDRVVYLKPQDKLKDLLPHCRKEVFPQAKHTIFYGDKETLSRYLRCVLDFLAG